MEIDIKKFSGPCECGRTHEIVVKDIYIESGAIRYLKDILKAYKKPVIICDGNTFMATKKSMEYYYDRVDRIMLAAENLHADDVQVENVERVLCEEADVLIAVGSGTIHDLTRYVSYQHGIPFVSVPTAASVDGFVSTVAAMTWKGMKKTMQAQAPLYVIADTEILAQAPLRLTASGVSDLIGKYTALLDWKICHQLTGEYFCQRIYDLEFEAVKEVENVLDKIKNGDKGSIEKLIYALILSGLAMQMIGNSRPASGSEHHMSHLWEMEIINEHIDALHGEKVSVGLILVTEYYEKIKRAIRQGSCKVIDKRAYETELLQETFGKKGLYESVLAENDPNPLEEISLDRLQEHLGYIAAELEQLPCSQELERILKRAGCVTSLEEIGLSDEIKEKSLQLCPYVRRRLTLLRIAKNLQIE